MKRDSKNKEHNKVKRLFILLVTIALLFTTGAAVAQSIATTPSAAVDHSTLDAYALFAVAIFAVVGGLLIRRRSGNNI
jgi:hypothetical protein